VSGEALGDQFRLRLKAANEGGPLIPRAEVADSIVNAIAQLKLAFEGFNPDEPTRIMKREYRQILGNGYAIDGLEAKHLERRTINQKGALDSSQGAPPQHPTTPFSILF